MATLPRIQPINNGVTVKDFVDLQSRWAALLEPVMTTVNAGDGVPVGAILHWTTPTAPTKYLLSQGQLVLRSQYPYLFAVIGTLFNTGGEAAQYFRLPNTANDIIKYLP